MSAVGAVVEAEPFAERHGRIAGEDALLIGRPNVADGDEFEELGIVLADENAALVAGADHRGLDRLALELLIAEIARGAGHRDSPAGHDQALHEAAAGQDRRRHR